MNNYNAYNISNGPLFTFDGDGKSYMQYIFL